MKNRGQFLGFERFDVFPVQSSAGVTMSSEDKDQEMGVSEGLSRQRERGGGTGE